LKDLCWRQQQLKIYLQPDKWDSKKNFDNENEMGEKLRYNIFQIRVSA
jgi:hypothetical protein